MRKPKSERRCQAKCGKLNTQRDEPHANWVEDDWGICEAVSCGEPGLQRRKVHCDGPNINSCDIRTKPTTERACLHACDGFTWRSGPWGQCSHVCGRKGRQTRAIRCEDSRFNQEAPQNSCHNASKPVRRRKCNQHKCGARNCREIQRRLGFEGAIDREYDLNVKGKRLRVYCHGMVSKTHQHRHKPPLEYLQLPTELNNYAEMYGVRLSGSGLSCPSNGERQDSCPSTICSTPWPRAGLTLFSRVRLDVRRMRIVPDDYTHARNVPPGANPVDYGTAGDCYSAWPEGCPQGRFSIDLGEGAGVRLARHVVWAAQGRHAARQVHISEDGRKVSGKCGGRCGTCRPEGGLDIEIV